MNEVKFSVSYDYHDGFQWCATLVLDGKVLKGWGVSMELAAHDLEQALKDEPR